MINYEFHQLARLIRLAFIIIFNCFITLTILAQSKIELENCLLDGRVTLIAPQSDYGYDWIHSGETTSSITINKNMIGQEIICIVERDKKCDCECEEKDCGTEMVSYKRLISKSDFKKLNLNYTVGGLSCTGIQDGQINIEENHFISNYQFYWSDGSNKVSRKGLNSGRYTVTISNNRCTTILSFDVKQPENIDTQLLKINLNSPACFGGDDGNILISSKENINNFSFEWQNGQVGNELKKVPAGNYGVKMMKGENCLYKELKLENPEPLKSEVTVGSNYNGFPISCSGGKDGVVKIKLINGEYPFSLKWNGADDFEIQDSHSIVISDLISGLYKFKIKDAKGCVEEQQVLLTEPEPIQTKIVKSNFNGYQIKCYSDSNAYIKPIVFGGTGEYNFAWNGQNGFTSKEKEISNIKSGSYQVKITDSNGCLFVEDVIVKSPKKVRLLVNVSPKKIGRRRIVKLKAKGGTGQYTLNDKIKIDKIYKINTSNSSQFILIDTNGCTTKRKIKKSRTTKKKKKNSVFNFFPSKNRKYRNAKCPKF